MSPPATTVAKPRQRARRPRQIKTGITPAMLETPADSLVVRSIGPIDRCKSLTIRLSEPSPGEECSIGLEPIASFRLSFMPPDHKGCVIEDQPALTKASLPCGHGFNAMALLYHFAKHSMTCPICRAGHAKVQMGELSIPSHVRAWFARHLEGVRADENREQIATDAIAAARILEQEVRIGVSLPMTRVVLLLYPYASLENSAEPILEMGLPLTSSLTLDILAFASSGYSLAQMNLNLLRFARRPLAFEIGVGIQNLIHGGLLLFRTNRFSVDGPASRMVFAQGTIAGAPGTVAGEPMAIQVESLGGVFSRLSWTVSVSTFSSILVAAANGRENDVMAAV